MQIDHAQPYRHPTTVLCGRCVGGGAPAHRRVVTACCRSGLLIIHPPHAGRAHRARRRLTLCKTLTGATAAHACMSACRHAGGLRLTRRNARNDAIGIASCGCCGSHCGSAAVYTTPRWTRAGLPGRGGLRPRSPLFAHIIIVTVCLGVPPSTVTCFMRAKLRPCRQSPHMVQSAQWYVHPPADCVLAWIRSMVRASATAAV